jgi:hypothetical protein
MRGEPSIEFELLLRCAGTQVNEDQRDRIVDLIDRSPDWDTFLLVARRHGLIPLVHRTLSAPLYSGRAPPVAFTRLRSLAEAIRFQNLVVLSQLADVLRTFDAAGVTAVPYKGPALASYVFGDATLRQVSDLDFLVKPQDALRAQRALLDRGYHLMERIADSWKAAYVRFHGGFTFSAPDGRIVIEMNWRVAPWYWRLPEIPEAAWRRLGRLPLAGLSVPWFAPEDLLHLLCLHGCKHQWEQLKWLVDVAEILRLRSDLDLHQAMSEARRCGSARMLALGLLLAHDLLGADLPADLLRVIKSVPAIEALATRVCNSVFIVRPEPADTLTELAFLARTVDRLGAQVSCAALIPAYFLLHRVIRPGLATLRSVAAVSKGG